MILILIFSITVFIFFKFLLKKKSTIPQNLKPIPVVSGGLPIVGHLFYVTSSPFQYLNDLRDKYGPIYSIQIGWKNIIVLNNYDVINKTLKEQGNNFSGRWQNVFTKDIAKDCGILFKDKEFWATQRSFTLRVLKDFGFGKQTAENVVYREVEKLIKNIKFKNGKNIETTKLISFATVNIISDFIMKKEFEETDENILFLIKAIQDIARVADVNSLVMNVFPVFEWFPNLSKLLIHYFHPMKILQTIEKTTDFIGSIVDEHRKRFKPENDCQDLIDAFLFEQYKLQNSNSHLNSFTDWQVIRLISELFLAGYETTANTLSWTFLLLAKFSDVQNKMREEISNEIGLVRLPTMADKKSLNYCQAVLDEIFRFSTVLPLSIAHRVFDNASIDDYFIPANSILFPNLYACHRDPEIWKKPYDFYPEHFLDETGKYQPKFELIPFGLGKRQCLGEALARMEEFIVVICFIQNFNICLSDDNINMHISQLLIGSHGTFRGPLTHKLNFEEIQNR